METQRALCTYIVKFRVSITKEIRFLDLGKYLGPVGRVVAQRLQGP